MRALITFLIVLGIICAQQADAYTLRGDFEGASCENVVISGDNVTFTTKPFPNGTANSYFHCVVEGAQGRTLNFRVNINSTTSADDFSTHVNAYVIYNYMQPNSIEKPKLVTLDGAFGTYANFSFTIEQNTAHIVSRIPMPFSYIDQMINEFSGNPYFKLAAHVNPLVQDGIVGYSPGTATQPNGLPVKVIIITDSSVPEANKKPVYLRFGPHYSTEQTCPHQAEGLIRNLLSNDSLADSLRKNFTWIIAPLVNVDSAFYGLSALNSLGTDLENCGQGEFDPPKLNQSCPENFGIFQYAYQWIHNKGPLYYSYECHSGAAGRYGYRSMRDSLWAHKHAGIMDAISGLKHTGDYYTLPIMVKNVELWNDYSLGSGWDYRFFEITDEDGWNGVNLVTDAGLVPFDYTRSSMQRLGWDIAKTIATALNRDAVVGTVSGTVRDVDQTVLPGTEVTLASYSASRNTAIDGNPLQFKAVTDLHGRYIFDYVAQGSYRISASRSNYLTSSLENVGVLAGTDNVRIISLTPNNQAPELSNIAVSLGSSNSVEVSWTSSTPCASRVEYGPTTAYGNQVTSSAYETNHRHALPNLQASQTYYYKISCTDKSTRQTHTTPATVSTSITQLALNGALSGALPVSSSGKFSATLRATKTVGEDASIIVTLGQDPNNYYQIEARTYRNFDSRFRYKQINGLKEFPWGIVFTQYVNGKMVYAKEIYGDLGPKFLDIYDKDFPLQIIFRPWGCSVTAFGGSLQATYSDRPLLVDEYAISSHGLTLSLGNMAYSTLAETVDVGQPGMPSGLRVLN